MGAGMNNQKNPGFSNTMDGVDPSIKQSWGMGDNILSKVAGMAQPQGNQQVQSLLNRANPFNGRSPAALPMKMRSQFKPKTPGVRY